MNNKSGIIRFIVCCILLILSVGAMYSTLTFRLNAIEEKTEKYQSDHTYILILNTKVDKLLEDVKDVKSDMKVIKNRR